MSRITLPAHLAWLTARPIAHRGLHGLGVPENSLPAVERAVQEGFPIELDVQLTQDGQVVVFHDESLQRMTGADGNVADCAMAFLRDLRLHNTDCHIPTLTEVLWLVAGRVPLLIEIKNRSRQVGSIESHLWDLLREYQGPFAVQSFNPYSVAWFRRHAPHVARGQLTSDFRGEVLSRFRKWVLRNLLLNSVSRPLFIAADIRCLRKWGVRRAAWRRPLIGWTARSAAEHVAARRHCDNVIFEGYLPAVYIPPRPSG